MITKTISAVQDKIARQGVRALNSLRVASAVKDNETVSFGGLTFQAILNSATSLVSGSVPILLNTSGLASSVTQASGTVTSNNTNVSDGDTVTIGTQVFRFKTSPAAINDIWIGGSADASLLSLAKTINGTGVAGTDMFAGTLPSTLVTSSATVTSHAITLTAITRGTAGNSIILTKSATTLTVTGSGTLGGSGGTAATDCSATQYTTALTAVINSGSGRFAAERISANEVVVVSYNENSQIITVAETLSGANNVWAATTFYGRNTNTTGIVKESLVSRVPTATEIALTTMHFYFHFVPTAVIISQFSSTGTVKTFDGTVVIVGKRVTLTASGSISFATNDLVNVKASE